jgi:hypothetical protein
MIGFLFLLARCVYAGSYECDHYIKINDPTRNVGNAKFEGCDLRRYKSGWYRFIAPGNEMIPPYAPAGNMCGSHYIGWQSYGQPKNLYDTTIGKICYRRWDPTCSAMGIGRTTLCNGYYVYYLTWKWSWNGCNYRLCTTAYAGPKKLLTESPTQSPTDSPTKNPTNIPTELPSSKCVNKYGYCEYGSFLGACHSQDRKARESFLDDCPVSCGTCYGKTLIPTNYPTIKPTNSPNVPPALKTSQKPSMQPTDDPTSTCVDILPYCEFVKANCSSSDISVKRKLKNECALTCGICSWHPTASPSAPCVDTYSYCADLAGAGACNSSDNEARTHLHIDCPASCYTCNSKTVWPSYQPSISPTLPPTCVDVIGYCKLLLPYCNSSSLRVKMQSDCPSTCGFCISEPTVPPICEDAYAYCKGAALAGACYNGDFEGRLHFLSDCPASCNTCHNQTLRPTISPTLPPTLAPTAPTSSPSMNPSEKPTDEPTRIPTASPTCSDLIGYCEYVEGYCNSTVVTIRVKMQADCTYTCGFCSGGSEENTVEEARRRLAVNDQSGISADLAISLVLIVFLAVISALLLRHLFGRRYGNLQLDRKNVICKVTNGMVTFEGVIAELEGVNESVSGFTALNKGGGYRTHGEQ